MTGTRRAAVVMLVVGLVASNFASARATGADSSRQVVDRRELSRVRWASSDIAFEVNGEPTHLRVVIADLEALARNEALGVATVRDGGDSLPDAGIVATWITSLIYDRVMAQELAHRDVDVTAKERVTARKFERATFDPQARKALPEGFRSRQIARTARAATLASDEGLDFTRSRSGGHLVDLVTELARDATVVVAPRFGSWDPSLAVVVPPLAEGPSS